MTAAALHLCGASTIAEVRRQVLACRSGGDRPAFLVLSGSFSPVHNQHLASFDVARSALEDLGYTVVAGFLAPSTDAHAGEKSGALRLQLAQRIALCRLAIEHRGWLHVCASAELSSNVACRRIRRELEEGCADLPGEVRLVGAEIMGSDTAIRLLQKVLALGRTEENLAWQQGRIICCLLRRDAGGPAARQQIEAELVPAVADWGIRLIAIEPRYHAPGLESLSSTAIRRQIANGDWEPLASNGWLPEPVLRALRNST
jgi:hypothetical protein